MKHTFIVTRSFIVDIPDESLHKAKEKGLSDDEILKQVKAAALPHIKKILTPEMLNIEEEVDGMIERSKRMH